MTNKMEYKKYKNLGKDERKFVRKNVSKKNAVYNGSNNWAYNEPYEWWCEDHHFEDFDRRRSNGVGAVPTATMSSIMDAWAEAQDTGF